MPWLTGDTPIGAAVCRAIFVPNDPAFTSAVLGALLELTYEYNWEQEGDATPAEYAVLAQGIIESYGSCEAGGDMELIADVELGADVGYIEFTNIPQTYAALQIQSELQSNSLVVFDGIVLTFNGDTGANYGQGSTRVEHITSTHVAEATRNGNDIFWPRTVGTNTAGTLIMSSQKIDLPNYASTTRYKLARCLAVNLEDDNNANDYNTLFGVGRWNNIADGIETIRIAPGTGTVLKGQSRVRLYGLKGAQT